MTTILQADTLDPVERPFQVVRPVTQSAPLVIASPHSGRNYPSDFLAASRLDAHTLRRSEDCFVDELLGGATASGYPLLLAEFPRAYCDANREQWELDQSMFADTLPLWCNTRTARVAAGFGTIARQVSSGHPIYAGKLQFADAEQRIRTCWQPYHACLSELMSQTEHAFGLAVLIDCHSMPTDEQPGSRAEPDFVLGDAHGSACDGMLTRTAQSFLQQAGYRVRRNDPYAGGYNTRHYGQPRHNRHALQIEVSRRLYVDQLSYRKTPGFAAIRSLMHGLLSALAATARDLPIV